jgi:hypothetical protein
MSAVPLPLRVRIVATALIACVGLAVGVASRGQGQPARPPGAAGAQPDAKPPTKYIMPFSNCTQCHTAPERYKKDFDAGHLLCRMSEATIWTTNDKHKIAAVVLQGDRGKAMGERLGIKVAESTSCTNCHGINVTGAEVPPTFAREENGVTCVACHGAFVDWIEKHTIPNNPLWRGNTRRQKEERFGMTDLWDPVTRAAKCASCHIGSPEEQKVVTHAMYAAGHPPLPGLEVATFSEAQPRHWQYLREKPAAIQKELGFNPAKREQTDLVVASGIVALRDAMRLYAAEARDDTLVKEPETHWPDFARFDCYACHHDLKVPSWRQERGYGARTPGRPPVPAWPDVLVQLGLTVSDPNGTKGELSNYRHARDAFYAATASRPFSDRQQSAAAAQNLADWADGVSKELRDVFEDPQRVVVDGKMSVRLLHQLCQMALTAPLDFDSARQIAWSFQIIYKETQAFDPGVFKDPALGKLVDSLIKDLHMALPSAGEQKKIADSLPARLSAVFDFDPDAFQAHFAAMAQHLPPL